MFVLQKQIFIIVFFLIAINALNFCFAQEGAIIYQQQDYLYKFNLKDRKTTQLLTGIKILGPVFLKDYKKVAFITDIKESEMGPRYGILAVSDIDGGNFKKFPDITIEAGQFCWLDEESLAIVINYEYPSFLNVNTGQKKSINIEAERLWYPSCSPDGKTIAFRSSGSGSIGNVVFYDVDKLKSELAFSSSYEYGSDYFVAPVSWSFDSKETAFEVQSQGQAQQNDLYILKDGLSKIKFDFGYIPEFSPDGRKIAYASAKEDINNDGVLNYFDMKIYVYDVGTGTSKKVTSGNFHDSFIAWSPDSRYILYNEEEYAGGERKSSVYIVDIENLKTQGVCQDGYGIAWQADKKFALTLPSVKGGNNKMIATGLIIALIIAAIVFIILIAIAVVWAVSASKSKRKEIAAETIELKANPEDIEKLSRNTEKLSMFLVNKTLSSGQVLNFEGMSITVVSVMPGPDGKVTAETRISLS